ncbi:MAG TPA: class I adenylate-forming enzyme family protein [Candidatus Dormibacteraeota bacterium]|nr:class I adenylate-forming enzyme family protein [Candidatus Dormibacteraeota bacterium]
MARPLLHDLLDRTAERTPDAPAIGHGPRALTYGEVRAVSRRIAGHLAARGVGRGDRVVVALNPDVAIPPLLYGCSRAGAVFAVIQHGAPDVVVAHVLDDCEPRLVVSDAPAARRLAAERGIACWDLDQLRAAADDGTAAPPADPRAPASLTVDPVCFIYTSGSTGMPKAVVSTHDQVTFAVSAIQSQLEYRPDDVVFCALPLSFDYGLYQLFVSTLAGARLQLGSDADAGHRILVRLSEARATVLPAVPPLARNLARLLSRPGATRPPLRLITNTGAAMPPSVMAVVRAGLPGVQVQLMFGLTECKRATIMPKDEDLRRPGACGRALPGTEVFVIGERGERLPAGQIGEIVVRGPNVMAGYWRRPELTAQRFHRAEGLFPELRTGDYGRLDGDGYLYFEGRRDDIYKERGYRVSVAEVEAAAHRVPGVDAAAVLPPGHGHDGAILLVVAQLGPPEVLARLRQQLEEPKIPSRCMVVERLPVNGNGKVDRARLARIAEGDGRG